VNTGFQTFFTLELTLRLVALGPDFFCSADCRRSSKTSREDLFWNYFDFIIVSCGLTQEVIAAWVADSGQKLGALFVVFRMLRILRVLRAIRILRKFPELYILLQGLGASVRSAVWVSVMFAMLLLICAVFVTEVVGTKADQFKGEDVELIYANFGTVLWSMRTLFIYLTFDDWSTLARIVNGKYPWMEFFWFTYLFIGSFTLLSLLTGLMADAMAKARDDHDKEMAAQTDEQLWSLEDDFKKIFHKTDRNADLLVDMHEFRLMLKDPDIKAILNGCNIDLIPEEAEDVFIALFRTVEPVAWAEFHSGLQLLTRYNDQASSKDIMLLEGQVLKLDRHIVNHMGPGRRMEEVDNMCSRVSLLKERVKRLDRNLEAMFKSAGYCS